MGTFLTGCCIFHILVCMLVFFESMISASSYKNPEKERKMSLVVNIWTFVMFLILVFCVVVLQCP